MPTFETFPYTNFQDLNLDWIIKKLKEFEAKDYDDIIAEILRRLSIAEETIINNYNDLSTRINNLTQIVNQHYLDLSNRIMIVDNRVTIVENAVDDLRQRVMALEDKVDGMYFRVYTPEEFAEIPHLPMHQYWVTDGVLLELWLGDQQLKFNALYRPVLTTIVSPYTTHGEIATTITLQEALT